MMDAFLYLLALVCFVIVVGYFVARWSTAQWLKEEAERKALWERKFKQTTK